MIHYGDITKLSGYNITPVDVITGGSPCQNLSIAGNRKGLSGEQSSLFLHQIRVVKELRQRDRDSGRTAIAIRPRYMVWENVPGSFSSNKGEDFRKVLDEIVRIAEPTAPHVPIPEKGKWPKAGCIYDELGAWSIAWRVHDAQFWGVPQRRKRIALVSDFGGLTAPEILFERKGMQRDSEKGREKGEETTTFARGSIGKTICLDDQGGSIMNVSNGVSPTIRAQTHGNLPLVYDVGSISFQERAGCPSGGKGILIQNERIGALSTVNNQYVFDARGNGDGKTVCTITGDHENRVTDYTALCFTDQFHGNYKQSDKTGTETARQGKGTTTLIVSKQVRRLTPLECERLQGYPDGWTDIGEWTDSRGKKRQSSDTARYKALGNSIALPFWHWLLERISAQYKERPTLGSLFDGIGGFPLCWERINGTGSAIWASEIEEFPIAVTKKRFG